MTQIWSIPNQILDDDGVIWPSDRAGTARTQDLRLHDPEAVRTLEHGRTDPRAWPYGPWIQGHGALLGSY